MKKLLFLTLVLSITFSFGQKSEEAKIDLDALVKEKSADFNYVFAPLYNEKDTNRYNEFYKKSIDNGYDLGQIIALNLLGTYYRDQSQYFRSVELHNQALSFSEDKNIIDGILYSNNMLGVVYRRMDDVNKGLQYHYKALELAEKLEDKTDFTIRNTAIAVNGIGNANLILEEYESARNQFKRSFEIEKSIDNHLGLAINHQNIGITYEELNQPDSAQYHYFESLKENRLIGNEIGKMICYNSIGRIYLKKEKFHDALKYFDQAEAIAEEAGDSFYTATIYYQKGVTLLNLTDYQKAKAYLDKSLELSIKHNLKSNQSETYSALASYYEQQGNYKEALYCVNKSKDVQSDYLNENNLRLKNNLEISYETESKANQILSLKKEKDEIIEKVSKKQQTILILIFLLGLLALLGILFYQRDKLRKEKQMLELEQKVLRAQMNPHFTFNALNSIKTYIISQNTEEAVKYLNKFAKLIRGVLYSSDKKVVTLAEELETVESYLSIERLRFKDPIALEVNVDELDLKELEIPPLILQPFIENALWHGLAPKTGDKKILIHVYRNGNNTICIDISDNGVGREASQKNNHHKTHQSLGVAISRKRLHNHFNLRKDYISLKFTDLKDDNDIPRGTKVSICIPN